MKAGTKTAIVCAIGAAVIAAGAAAALEALGWPANRARLAAVAIICLLWSVRVVQIRHGVGTISAYVAARLAERSAYTHLAAGVATAAIAPWPWSLVSFAISAAGALIPDGEVRR